MELAATEFAFELFENNSFNHSKLGFDKVTNQLDKSDINASVLALKSNLKGYSDLNFTSNGIFVYSKRFNLPVEVINACIQEELQIRQTKTTPKKDIISSKKYNRNANKLNNSKF